MWSYFKQSFVLNLLLLVIAIGALYHTYRIVSDAVSLRNETNTIAEKIDELTQKKEQLEAYLEELKTKEAIEREARERFNLKKPGEEVVVVLPNKHVEDKVPEATGFWARIKSFFQR